ncbi:MAG: hypothetical protein ABIG64_04475 [Candidatus Omnitrophota bacterium]
MSLFSAFSIIMLILIIVSAWILLEQAQNLYWDHFMSKRKFKKHQIGIFHKNNISVWDKIKNNLETLNRKTELNNNIKTVIQLLEKYARAQEIYYKNYGIYAENSASLIIKAQDGQFQLIDADLKVISMSNSRQEPYCGYTFKQAIIKDSNQKSTGFTLFAIPAKNELAGPNILCIDNQGIVKYDHPKGEAVTVF